VIISRDGFAKKISCSITFVGVVYNVDAFQSEQRAEQHFINYDADVRELVFGVKDFEFAKFCAVLCVMKESLYRLEEKQSSFYAVSKMFFHCLQRIFFASSYCGVAQEIIRESKVLGQKFFHEPFTIKFVNDDETIHFMYLKDTPALLFYCMARDQNNSSRSPYSETVPCLYFYPLPGPPIKDAALVIQG